MNSGWTGEKRSHGTNPARTHRQSRCNKKRIFAAALAAGVGLALGSRAKAASSDTWIGNDGSNNNWSDGLDWLLTTAPNSGDSLVFGAAGSSGTALNDNLGAAFSINSISYLTGAGAFTFSTNNTSSIKLGTASGASIFNDGSSLETISNINLALQGNLTVNTAYGNETIDSVISGAFNLLKIGSATLTLGGANTYTGQTSVGDVSGGAVPNPATNFGGGTLDLNFGTAGAPVSNILYNGVTAGQLNLGGGTLEIDGANSTNNSQSFGVLNLTAGFSTIDINPGGGGTVAVSTTTWTAPAITATDINGKAGQLNILIPTGATMTTTQPNTTSTTGVTGLLSFGGNLANVTVNSTSWAFNNGGKVIGLSDASYFQSTATAVGSPTQATDLVTSTTIASGTTNSLRFNTPAAETLTVSGLLSALTVRSGGILMTPNVGAHTETITSTLLGFLEGAPNTGISIFQYDTQGTLALNIPLVDNGTTNGLTVGGGGVVSMSTLGINLYDSSTTINSSTLEIVQNSNLGAQATGAPLNINGGTLQANATFGLYDGTATTDPRKVGIGTGGATFDVTGTNVLSISGAIISQNIAGAGNFTKTDTGTLNLSGTNTYAGFTQVNAGVLELSNVNSLPGGIGATGGTSPLIMDGGIVGLTTATAFNRGTGTGINQVQWTGSGGFAAYTTNATVNLGGAGATEKWNTNSFVPNGSALILGAPAATKTLTFQNPIDFNGAVQTIQVNRGTASVDATLSGVLSDSTNTTGGFNKTGTGILSLTATSTYTGATNINAGTLSLLSGGSLGNTAVGINSAGILTTSGTTSNITGTVTVNTGGSLDLRNGAAGDRLTLNNLSLAGGGSLGFDIAPSGSSDSLAISNFSNTGLTSVNFAQIGTLAAGSWTLINGGTGINASDFVYNSNFFSGFQAVLSAPGGTSLVLTLAPPPPPPPFAYWKGGVDSVWSDSTGATTNWVDVNGVGVALPASSTQIIFSATGGATNQSVTNIGATTSVDSVTINDPTNMTIMGTGTLTLAGAATGNGIVVNSTAGTDTISPTGIALGASQTWENNSSNPLTVSSIISGSGKVLTINSAGTGPILLSGANTYTGGTIITAGTLQAGSATALGTAGVAINGGALDLDGVSLNIKGLTGTSSGTITNSNANPGLLTDSLVSATSATYAGSITNGTGTTALSFTGSGTEVLTGGSNTFTGGTTIGTTATLIIGDGVSNTGSLSGNVVDNKSLEFNIPASLALTYNGNVSGTGSITNIAAGSVTLGGDDTNTAGLTITNGTVQMGSNTGVDKIPVTIAANGTLDLNSYSVTATTLNAASTATTALVTNSNVAATSTLTVGATSTFYGKISDGAGQTALALTAGTFTLENPGNSYSGSTTINGGVFALKGGASLGNTAVAINGGTLTTSGATSTIAGSVSVNSGGSLDLRNGTSGDLLTMNTLNLTGGGSLGFDISQNVNDSLAITNYSATGNTILNFTNVGAALTAGSWTLITGGTGISTSNFSFNSNVFPGFTAGLSAPGGTSLVVSIGVLPPPPAVAYWQGSVDSVWSDANGTTTNWVDVNGVGVGNPGSNTQVIFSATGGATNQANTTIGNTLAVDSITVNDPTNMTIGGTGTLSLFAAATGNGIVVNSTAGTDVINIPGLVLNASQTWENNSSNLLTVSSVISGATTSALTINGTGTGAILLAAANTYAGGTTITNGTLQVGNANALGTGVTTINGGALDLNNHALTLRGVAGSGGIVTNSGASLATLTDTLAAGVTTTYAGSIVNGVGGVALTLTGSGTQVLTGLSNTFTGGTTISGTDVLQIGDGATSGGSLSGNVVDTFGTVRFDTPANVDVVYNGNVSGLLGEITQTGLGTVTLGGNNTVDLGVSIMAGTVQMGSATGIDAVPATLAASSTLDLNSYSETIYSLTAAATATTANVTNNVNATTSTLTVTTGGTYNGTINNSATGSGTVALAVTGGTLSLINMNSTYSGGTTINNSGVLQVGNGTAPSGFPPFADSALGTGLVTITKGTLLLNTEATTSTPVEFDFSNNIVMNGNATLQNSTGNNVFSGSLAINGTGNTATIQFAQMPLAITGPISGSGSLTVSGVSNTNPPKNLQLYGDGTNFTGTITLNASAAQLFVGGNTSLLNANLLINGNYTATSDTADIYYINSVGSSLVFSPTNSDPSIGSINSVHTGDGNISLSASDGQTPVILSIGNNNANSLISGIISDTPSFAGAFSLAGGITKVGTGTLSLTAANTYSGTTTVQNGTLSAANTSGSATGLGNILLNGGVLASGTTGTISGNVLAGIGAHTIAPGGIGTIGTLNIGGLTTSNLTTLNFDLGTGSGLVTNGDLLNLGSGTVNIAAGTMLSFGNSGVGGDTYQLIGGNITGINLANFTLPTVSGFSYSLSTSGGFIDVGVTATGPQSMTWNNTGAGAPTDGVTWDTTHNNWNNGSGPTTYSDGANVTFNDTNNSHYAVTLNTTVNPGSVTFSNSGTYTLSGTGSIAGTASLTKTGTGTATISTPNTYSGGTIVNGGTLVIGPTTVANTVALPDGAVTIAALGELQLADNASASSPNSVTNQLMQMTSLSITSGGVLDIRNNHFFVADPGGTPDDVTYTSILSYVQSGAITSTEGLLGYSIGVVDGNDHVSGALTSANQIEVAYTLDGDANLDGKVDATDFGIFAPNFGATGFTLGWEGGDFNYDGKVDATDFGLFAPNFGQSDSGTAVSLPSADYAALDAFAAANGLSLTSVPEPASLGLLTLGTVGVLARRRRKPSHD